MDPLFDGALLVSNVIVVRGLFECEFHDLQLRGVVSDRGVLGVVPVEEVDYVTVNDRGLATHGTLAVTDGAGGLEPRERVACGSLVAQSDDALVAVQVETGEDADVATDVLALGALEYAGDGFAALVEFLELCEEVDKGRLHDCARVGGMVSM